jgi:hypothetical protein
MFLSGMSEIFQISMRRQNYFTPPNKCILRWSLRVLHFMTSPIISLYKHATKWKQGEALKPLSYVCNKEVFGADSHQEPRNLYCPQNIIRVNKLKIDRLERILTMVYVVQSYWACFGLYPSSCMWKTKNPTTFRRLDLSPSSGGWGRTNLLSWVR